MGGGGGEPATGSEGGCPEVLVAVLAAPSSITVPEASGSRATTDASCAKDCAARISLSGCGSSASRDDHSSLSEGDGAMPLTTCA
jgi:hypothetical protein